MQTPLGNFQWRFSLEVGSSASASSMSSSSQSVIPWLFIKLCCCCCICAIILALRSIACFFLASISTSRLAGEDASNRAAGNSRFRVASSKSAGHCRWKVLSICLTLLLHDVNSSASQILCNAMTIVRPFTPIGCVRAFLMKSGRVLNASSSTDRSSIVATRVRCSTT